MSTQRGFFDRLAGPGSPPAREVVECSESVHIRWMIRRDMPEVLAIEAASAGAGRWDMDTFVRHLRERIVWGLVAEVPDGRIVGFMVYRLHPTQVEVLRLAVAPESRRRGVGSRLALKLLNKLSADRRTRIDYLVPEADLDRQLFLRACGFICTECRADGYLFQTFHHGPEPA